MSIIGASWDPWCHFSQLYKLNNSKIPAVSLRRTVYGYYKEGLFSTPTNFSSSYPSFPDLARWRHTLENIPEIVDINRTLLLSPAPHMMTMHWWRDLLDEDTGLRQPVDQEGIGGLHWRPTTLASPSGLWCFMQQEGLLWCRILVLFSAVKEMSSQCPPAQELRYHRRNWLAENTSKSKN